MVYVCYQRGVYSRHPYGVLLGNLCGKTNVLLIFIASFFHRPPTQLLQLLGRVWGYSVVRTTPLQTFRDNGDTLVVIALASYPGVKRSVPMCGMVWWCVFRIPVGLLVIISHLYSSKLNAYSSILCISLRLVSSYRNLYYYFWQGARTLNRSHFFFLLSCYFNQLNKHRFTPSWPIIHRHLSIVVPFYYCLLTCFILAYYIFST